MICKRLVRKLVESGLRGLKAVAWTYLDDVLIAAQTRRRAAKAHRRVTRVLRKARFVINEGKSVSEPQREMEFVGKIIDTRSRTVRNKQGTLIAATRAWLKAIAKR